MTIDLDDLERKARAATPGPWTLGRGYNHNGRSDDASRLHDVLTDDGVEVLERCVPPDAEFAVAASPDVVLALVARIRELEECAIDGARTIEGWVTCETQEPVREDDPDWKQAERIRALVEKGVTL